MARWVASTAAAAAAAAVLRLGSALLLPLNPPLSLPSAAAACVLGYNLFLLFWFFLESTIAKGL